MISGIGLERRAGEWLRKPTSGTARRLRNPTSEDGRGKGALRTGVGVFEIEV
jgi:hypothetical protein